MKLSWILGGTQLWSSLIILGFSFNALNSAYFLVSGKNPVYAVLLLIGVFLNVGGLCLLFHADFLTYVSLIVYVGAISILFLFVVMMLDLKVSKYESNPSNILLILSLLALGLLVGDFLWGLEEIWYTEMFSTYLKGDSITSPQNIGLSLYTDHIEDLLVTGMLLLVSMMGAILLSLGRSKEDVQANQFLCEQLSRNFKNSILS